MSKGGFMKDALILFAITLVAGACLGGVYEITKDPIAAANQAAKERAFREVLADADSFAMDDYSAALDKVNTEVKELDFGNVSVDECATGKTQQADSRAGRRRPFRRSHRLCSDRNFQRRLRRRCDCIRWYHHRRRGKGNRVPDLK